MGVTGTKQQTEDSMKIRIENKFHSTEASVVVDNEFTGLSPTQYRRLRKKLCPHTVSRCQCFGRNMVRVYDKDDREIEWEFALADIHDYNYATMGLMGYAD